MYVVLCLAVLIQGLYATMQAGLSSFARSLLLGFLQTILYCLTPCSLHCSLVSLYSSFLQVIVHTIDNCEQDPKSRDGFKRWFAAVMRVSVLLHACFFSLTILSACRGTLPAFPNQSHCEGCRRRYAQKQLWS